MQRFDDMAIATLVAEDTREWATACAIQQRFMQHAVPAIDTLDYSAKCRQVHDLGGDFYDFMPRADGCLALAVSDASGKGVAAALMISNVHSSLRTAALFSGDNGAAALGAVNRHVYATSLADRYATLFYGVFDRTSRTLRYVNAGHNPPMILRRGRAVGLVVTRRGRGWGGSPVGHLTKRC